MVTAGRWQDEYGMFERALDGMPSRLRASAYLYAKTEELSVYGGMTIVA